MTIGFDLGHGLDLEFARPNMEFAISQPKVVQRSGVRIYQIVTGVTSDVGIPSTHLVYFSKRSPLPGMGVFLYVSALLIGLCNIHIKHGLTIANRHYLNYIIYCLFVLDISLLKIFFILRHLISAPQQFVQELIQAGEKRMFCLICR